MENGELKVNKMHFCLFDNIGIVMLLLILFDVHYSAAVTELY